MKHWRVLVSLLNLCTSVTLGIVVGVPAMYVVLAALGWISAASYAAAWIDMRCKIARNGADR
jgi:hypothetical protein